MSESSNDGIDALPIPVSSGDDTRGDVDWVAVGYGFVMIEREDASDEIVGID